MAGVATLGVDGLEATRASIAVAPVDGVRQALCSAADESCRPTEGTLVEGCRAPPDAGDLKDADRCALDILTENGSREER